MKPTEHQLQITMACAMHIRNELEAMHGEGAPCEKEHRLTDAQMKRINPIVRKALVEFCWMLDNNSQYLGWLKTSIPEYWEEPDISEDFIKSAKQFNNLKF